MLSAFCRTAKRSTCKAAPPLPKNLAALRFSGALFFEPRSRMGLARCVSENKRSYFHAFTLFKGEGGPLAVDEGCPNLAISTPPKLRMVSPHQALRASFPLRGKPCIETCSERVTVLYKIPPLALLGRDDKEKRALSPPRGAAGRAEIFVNHV